MHRPKSCYELFFAQALLKIVRSTLNKLTPQKFSPLMSRLQKISNRTTQCMKEMVNIIVEEVGG